MPRAGKTTLVLCLLLAGCQKQEAIKQNKSPEKPADESELAITTLTERDAKYLKIETQKVQLKEVQERLALTGWIMAKQGNEVTVNAPVAGYVRAVEGDPVPFPGQPISKGTSLFQLDPVLSVQEEVTLDILKVAVDKEKYQAKLQLDQAETEFKRAVDLKELTPKEVLEKKALAVKLATKDLDAANFKLKSFDLKAKILKAPADGTVLMVHVSPGQYVAAAAPLVTIVDMNPIWVRVPVPEHDLKDVKRDEPALILPQSPKRDGGAKPKIGLEGKWVTLVPQVDLVRHTADLVYEVQIPAKGTDPATRPIFAKDLMVTVEVPLGRNQTETVVPYSAIIFDAHGGTWIYVLKGTIAAKDANDVVRNKYARRRVELIYMIGDDVVVRRSGDSQPVATANELVVTRGAAEIFSREFHKTPVNP